jgi:hypothetical protein
MYISTLYVLIKLFRGKPIFFVLCAKEDKNWCLKNLFEKNFFIIFILHTKHIFFFAKLGVHTYNIDITR